MLPDHATLLTLCRTFGSRKSDTPFLQLLKNLDKLVFVSRGSSRPAMLSLKKMRHSGGFHLASRPTRRYQKLEATL